MDDACDKEQQEISETIDAPRETNPIIPDTSNEEEESDDIRNEEEEENDDNRYENSMIEEAEVQATRHSTHLQKSSKRLIEQDDLHTVGKKSYF